VQGTVQGVGFRPFVYRLAHEFEVAGWVLNDARGVTIEATAAPEILEQFQYAIQSKAPPAAKVESVAILESRVAENILKKEFRRGDPRGRPLGHHSRDSKRERFVILESQDSSNITTLISPDLPVCQDCLLEMLDPNNRRYRYPFINCTNCGPRYSIIEALPYDRPKTTMKAFALCEACEREYRNPLDRRFHAQPVACSSCGPDLHYLASDGTELARGDAVIECAATALQTGLILAVKGLGGYHLACDARNKTAVTMLRLRKFRKEKPFALMAKNIQVLEGLVELSDAAKKLLEGLARPIVLLPKTSSDLPDALAPDNSDLGVMLPYTPLQNLLFDAGAPDLLVMTSANHSSEPIAYRDDEALERLGDLVDGFVVGTREIARRVDDSVTNLVAGFPTIVRRARGYAPAPVLHSPRLEQPILGVGAELKSSITLAVHGHAFVSQHLGDLENLDAFEAFQETVCDLSSMYRVNLEDALIVHDLHPNYASTKFALEFPRTLSVQHHRAHIASVLAERANNDPHAWRIPVLGFAFDGTGLGDDGTIWGGEIFFGSLERGFERVGHLKNAPLPGGDAAARNPVQAAVGFLEHQFSDRLLEPPFDFPAKRVHVARGLLRANLNTIPTSSIGRLFDTVAALLGFTRTMSFEGQAAIWLEHLARHAPIQTPYPFAFDGQTWDYMPLLERVLEDAIRGLDKTLIARCFHEAIAHGILEATLVLSDSRHFDAVVLSGGVFQNRLLTERSLELLAARGFKVWINREVPANDGGISLGQVAMAAARNEV
jgi:hydrogenase maturation protein HypF